MINPTILTQQPFCNHWEWLIPTTICLIILLSSLFELRRGHRAPPVSILATVIARREIPDSDGPSRYAIKIRAKIPENPETNIEAEAFEKISEPSLGFYPIDQPIKVTWVPGNEHLFYLEHYTTMQSMKQGVIASAIALGICLYWGLF